MALRIELVPPLGAVLQIAGKPCHDSIVPEHTLCIISHKVIFALYLDKLHLLAQDLQSIEELDTLTDRHIGIDRTVQEQQRSVDLVGIEERALLGEEVGVLPGIAVGSCYGIVAVAPVTFTQ